MVYRAVRNWAVLLGAMAILVCRSPAAELSYAIYLRVNGRPITQDNVVQAVKFLLGREYNNVMPADEEEQEGLQRAAIRDLVRSYIIHHEAGLLGIRPDRNSARRALAGSGVPYGDVTPTVRRMLEADSLFDEIMMREMTPVKDPSPREIKDFYLRNRDSFRTDAFVKIRTLFIAVDGSRPQSYFKDRAEDIMRTLQSTPREMRTDAFAKAAMESSQDVFAPFGGLLTADSPEQWIPQEFANKKSDGSPVFPAQMAEGIRRMKNKGEIRLAVSDMGMHLLYLEDVRGGNVIGWDEASRIIEYYLKQRARNERLRAWIGRAFDRSDVRWHDGSAYDKAQLTESILPSERGGEPGFG